MSIKHFILLVILGCSSYGVAQNIDLSTLPEVEDYTVVRTNPQADTVILTLHGGPLGVLVEGIFTEMENEPNFNVVEVKKYEMLHPVLNDSLLTKEEAIAINDTTVAMLEKVVQHYNDEEKIVILMGQSWGAVLLAEYMDDYTSENVHRIIAMEGRLNMPLEFIAYLEDGYFPTFTDGSIITLSSAQYEQRHGKRILVAAALENRWIDSLSNLDLRNLMYTYAENDVNTGALLPEETDFLNETGATTLFIEGGFHGISFSSENHLEIVNFIRDENVVNTKEINRTIDKLIVQPSLADHEIEIRSEQKGILRVFDMFGKLVYQDEKHKKTKRINVVNLTNGLYIASLQLENNQLKTAKFKVAH